MELSGAGMTHVLKIVLGIIIGIIFAVVAVIALFLRQISKKGWNQ